jgi:uncharacterized LabA/DUF88 family protein
LRDGKMEEKAMMFIDGSNLFYGCMRYKSGYKIDLLKLREKLINNRKLIRAYYYCSIPIKGDAKKINNQEKFYHFLEYNGFKVVKIPLRIRSERFTCKNCNYKNEVEKQIEKGVDVALVTDMLSLGSTGRYDIAIIVTGDLDYLRAIDELQRRGINVEIAFFRGYGISNDMIRCADKFIPLDDIAESIRKT